MAQDPLRVLLKVRRRIVDQARLNVGLCLEAEAAASKRIDALDEMVRRNQEAGENFPERNQFLEIIYRRHDEIRAQRTALVDALKHVQTQTAEARAVLVTVRTSAEVVEQLVDERAAADAREAERREQHTLDDIARALFWRQRIGQVIARQKVRDLRGAIAAEQPSREVAAQVAGFLKVAHYIKLHEEPNEDNASEP